MPSAGNVPPLPSVKREAGQSAGGSLFAEFRVRLVALLIDLIIVGMIAFVVNVYIIKAIGLDIGKGQTMILLTLLLYFSMCWWSRLKATPAQLLFAIRVVDTRGEKLSLLRSLLRSALLILLIGATWSLFKVVSNPYLIAIALPGYALLFVAALTPNRQAAHDMLVRTLVVKRKTLISAESRNQLLTQVSDRDPASTKQRRPSVFGATADLFVLGVPVLLMLFLGQMMFDRNLRYRTGYAMGEVSDLKNKVESLYLEHSRWPENGQELGVPSRTAYPDGGYYELEREGVIRIHFTVIDQLKKGSIVLTPRLEADRIVWKCSPADGFAKQYLIGPCRN